MATLSIFLSVISGVSLLASYVHATTRHEDSKGPVTKQQSQAASASCEFEGFFRKETHTGDGEKIKIYWIFDAKSTRSIDGGECPQGAEFWLRIRGANYGPDADGKLAYYYPVDVVPPESSKKVSFRVWKIQVTPRAPEPKYEEWLALDGADQIGK